ncbi:hypothetical protein LIER_21092 [Lithospermum erythrorhizon]|uniref:Uncharacterized protein n=1 Tax=Lithospermum erythrorhizon TaxID=34254 RepID=A0AAV3QUP0_LITER
MASIMAKGSRVSLAPPILAFIYRRLSQISLSNNPSTVQECFPAQNTANKPNGPLMVRFMEKLGCTLVVPGLSSSTREMTELFTDLKLWRFYTSEDSRCSPKKHGKWESLPAGMRFPPLVFKSSSSSKRKRSSDNAAEDRDPKHARGGGKYSLRGSVFPLARIRTRLKEKSPEMILKGEEGVLSTFQVLTTLGLIGFPDLHDKLHGLFSKAREAYTTLITTSQDNTSEALSKLAL